MFFKLKIKIHVPISDQDKLFKKLLRKVSEYLKEKK